MSVWQVMGIFVAGATFGSFLTVLYDAIVANHRWNSIDDEVNTLGPIIKKMRETPRSHEDHIYQLTLDEREAARRRDQAMADAIREKDHVAY